MQSQSGLQDPERRRFLGLLGRILIVPIVAPVAAPLLQGCGDMCRPGEYVEGEMTCISELDLDKLCAPVNGGVEGMTQYELAKELEMKDRPPAFVLDRKTHLYVPATGEYTKRSDGREEYTFQEGDSRVLWVDAETFQKMLQELQQNG